MSKKKNTINIDDHFEKLNDVSMCKHCKKHFKTDRIYNLKKHIEQVHKILLENKTCNELAKNMDSPLYKYKTKIIKCEISKKLLMKSYVELVTEEAVSFNFLNSVSMRNIIDPICKGIEKNTGKKFCLNAANCKKTLAEVAANVVKAISKECENRLISLKIDTASRLSRNIFGISAQYIRSDIIHSTMLGMVELKGQYCSTSRNLSIEILNVLNKYKINLQQIVTITSDNGSNMIKSTKILSHCLCEEENRGEIYDNSIYFETINSMDFYCEMMVGDIEICRCAAHTSQLCALDTIKNAKLKHEIENCRNIVKFLRKNSNGFKDVFELKSVKLPQLDCLTRWGSTYNMVNDLKNAKDIIESVEPIQDKSSEENFYINADFWEFIESYCLALSPLQKSIIKFQEEQLHYGDFYAQWLRCKLLTTKLINDSNVNKDSILYKICTILLNSIENRSTKLLLNSGLIACLYLDPRFHHTLEESQKMEAINYLKKLWEKLNAICQVDITDNSINYSITTESNITDEDEDILESFLNQVFEVKNTNVVDVSSKIERLNIPYAKSTTNVIDFWKERKHSDPEIYALSNICFAIPPTQVSVERAFSSLKLVLTENRNRLNKDTLENIMLVKLNPSFLDEAIDELNLFEENVSNYD